MNKILIILLIILTNTASYADIPCNYAHKPTYKERKEFDSMIEKRLNLTAEQKNYIKNNRQKNRREMEKIVSRMQDLHDKIKNVYIIGIPKWQADLKTAPMKTELYMLKQEAQKIKSQHKKEFESILDENQKQELENLKKEFISSKH